MNQAEDQEKRFSCFNPSILANMLLENFDSQRRLLRELDDLENEAIELRVALSPAFDGWETTRVLVGSEHRPRLMLIHKRVDGGIEPSYHDLVRAEELKFPGREPDRPEISLLDGTKVPVGLDDVHDIDVEAP